jgi:hypothetical protein
MNLMIGLALSGAIGFYLRFLWAMSQELKRFRRASVASIPSKTEPGTLKEIDLSEIWRAMPEINLYLKKEGTF